MIKYSITVRVLEFNGVLKNETAKSIKADWNLVSTFQLNPTQTIGRSKNGKVSKIINHNFF